MRIRPFCAALCACVLRCKRVWCVLRASFRRKRRRLFAGKISRVGLRKGRNVGDNRNKVSARGGSSDDARKRARWVMPSILVARNLGVHLPFQAMVTCRWEGRLGLTRSTIWYVLPLSDGEDGNPSCADADVFSRRVSNAGADDPRGAPVPFSCVLYSAIHIADGAATGGRFLHQSTDAAYCRAAT